MVLPRVLVAVGARWHSRDIEQALQSLGEIDLLLGGEAMVVVWVLGCAHGETGESGCWKSGIGCHSGRWETKNEDEGLTPMANGERSGMYL